MTTPRERALEEVKRIVFDALADSDARVYLYGSCAREEARRSSDIDVAIDPKEPLPPDLLARVRETLEESAIPYFVDVVDLSAVDPDFRRQVLSDGVVWKD